MRKAWRAVTVVAVLGAACEPTAESIQGIANGGGTATLRLAFTVQPIGAIEDQIITPPLQVSALDSLGNIDATFTRNVTVALGTSPVGANLEGTRTVAAVFGVANFGELSIDRAGTGYRLVATAVGAEETTSTAFDITPRQDRSRGLPQAGVR